MRSVTPTVSAGLLAVAFVVGTGAPPTAHATTDDYSINGTFTATSDGTYATTNYAFHNQDTVRSTWRITSKCTTDVKCKGQVSSDQGWTAPLYTEGHTWYVQHDVPNWETCPDGSVFNGHQEFMFYPANANGVTQIGSSYLEGKDKTVGPRYACSTFWFGRPLTIELPFRLDKVG